MSLNIQIPYELNIWYIPIVKLSLTKSDHVLIPTHAMHPFAHHLVFA